MSFPGSKNGPASSGLDAVIAALGTTQMLTASPRRSAGARSVIMVAAPTKNGVAVTARWGIDHGGTPTDPSDDEFLAEELVKGSTGRSDDFCEAAVPALS